MLVETADKLICPFMGEISSFEHHPSGYCITTKCMAWKEETKVQSCRTKGFEKYEFHYPNIPIVEELGYNEEQVLEWTIKTGRGYCRRLGEDNE